MPIRKTPTSSNTQSGAVSALTPRTIFSAASNTAGNKIAVGSAYSTYAVGGAYGHFVVAVSAPAAITDGVTVSAVINYMTSSADRVVYKIFDDLFVPSGYGLYFIESTATTGTTTDVSWSVA